MMRRSIGKSGLSSSIGATTAHTLRAEFLTRIAKWASAVVPPLGALWGHRLAGSCERSGASIGKQLQCERCATIIATSDEFSAVKRAGSKVCGYCGHNNNLKKKAKLRSSTAATPDPSSSSKKNRKRKSWPSLKDIAAAGKNTLSAQKVVEKSEKVAKKKIRMSVSDVTPKEKSSNGRVEVMEGENGSGGGGEADFKLSALRKVVQFDSSLCEAQEVVAESGKLRRQEGGGAEVEDEQGGGEADSQSVENGRGGGTEMTKVSSAELVNVEMETETELRNVDGSKEPDVEHVDEIVDMVCEVAPASKEVAQEIVLKDSQMEERELELEEVVVPASEEATKDLDLNSEPVTEEPACLEEVVAEDLVYHTQAVEETMHKASEMQVLALETHPAEEVDPALQTHNVEDTMLKASEMHVSALETHPAEDVDSAPEKGGKDERPTSEVAGEEFLESPASDERDTTFGDKHLEQLQTLEVPGTTFAEPPPSDELDRAIVRHELLEDKVEMLEQATETVPATSGSPSKSPALEQLANENSGAITVTEHSRRRDPDGGTRKSLARLVRRRDPAETLKTIVRSFSHARTIRTACQNAYLAVVRQKKVLVARSNREGARATSEKSRLQDLSSLYKSLKKVQRSQQSKLEVKLPALKSEIDKVSSEVSILSGAVRHLVSTVAALQSKVAADELERSVAVKKEVTKTSVRILENLDEGPVVAGDLEAGLGKAKTRNPGGDDKSSKKLGICSLSRTITKKMRSPSFCVKGRVMLTKVGRRWRIGNY